MDIYKFSITLKQEDYEAMVIVDSINNKRKKNIQVKGYDKVRNSRIGRLSGYGRLTTQLYLQ